MILGRTYLHIAIISVFCAMVCYMCKLVHFDAENVIIKAPAITLYDIIYFNAENFVNLFSFITITMLSYFIGVNYHQSLFIVLMRYLMLYITVLLFVRLVFHFFTYDKPYMYEYIVYMCILIVFIVRVILYNLKHLSINGCRRRNATNP